MVGGEADVKKRGVGAEGSRKREKIKTE